MAPMFYFLSCYMHLLSLMPTLFPVGSSAPVKSLCHDYERHALLQLKQSFSITEGPSHDPLAYPKVAYWGLLQRGANASTLTDCCWWDGVECDRETGHVIGLDLSSSCLQGSINSSSTLFHLLHLQKLNLGDNNFSYSQIPSQLRLLTGLTYLNLSFSVFSGKIPLELTELSNLTSLDLGNNCDPSTEKNLLELHPSNIKSLVQNLTKLQTLVLSNVNISSTLPNIWANLSSLAYLDLRDCNLWGPFPTSLGELTKLTYLELSGNSFSGIIPSWFSKLQRLTSLNLGGNNLIDKIPSLVNLTHLGKLDLYSNQLIGQIPLWLANLTQFTFIDLGANRFHGTIPESIFSSHVNLEHVDLRQNYFTGTVNFDIFLGLKHLTYFHVTGNNLSLVNTIDGSNATFLKFTHLGLGNCHLAEFPNFLRHQDRLSFLSLHGNYIQGQIPKWLGNVLGKTLIVLFLSENYLTGFEQLSMLSSFGSIECVDLNGNRIEGSLPIPPPSTVLYNAFNNLLTGEISWSVCGLSSLVHLDLSSNNLSGRIPGCLGNFSDSLLILKLANNSLSGHIPETFTGRSALRIIDLSHNRLEGGLPKSLANCKMLESLSLSENQISDTFPFWLGTLPKLRFLILRSNQLFGTIESHQKYFGFLRLQILDLSRNNFTGILPVGLLQRLSSMKAYSLDQLAYMQSSEILKEREFIIQNYAFQLVLANRGSYMKYFIPHVMAVIDLSSNGFQGHISPAIGMLKMINVLNLSNNDLSGSIPSNLGDLTSLDSLDLSHNMLSGAIPIQLVQLTLLVHFDVSHNQLEGPIPRGKQFDTFENDSYADNLGLCGHPLSRKCGGIEGPSPPHPPNYGKEHGKNFRMHVGLMIVLMGYGSGLVVGLVIGHRFTTRKGGWFLKKFGRRQGTQRRRTKMGPTNKHIIWRGLVY